MPAFFTTVSILAITALVWLAEKNLPLGVCPICAGVSATWIGLIALKFAGYSIDMLLPAILMGGSIVGIAYRLEKRLPAGKFKLLFKTIFIPAGFMAAYGLLSSSWIIFFCSLVALALALYSFGKINWLDKNEARQPTGAVEKSGIENADKRKLEKEMKNCC